MDAGPAVTVRLSFAPRPDLMRPEKPGWACAACRLDAAALEGVRRLEFDLRGEGIGEILVEMPARDALFTFEGDETGKHYIIYTNDELDGDGCTKGLASIYEPDGDPTKLLPIETEAEWKMIEELVAELEKECGEGKQE